MPKDRYSAVIIGAGSIGALKPDKYDSPNTENILTHAHAIYNNPETELIAIVDNDIDKANKAADKWSCKPLYDLQDAPFLYGSDIYVVATPTHTHKRILESVLTLKPKIVIAEKPFTRGFIEAKMVSDLYEKNNIPLVVNYSRRFTFEYGQIKEMIDSEKWGKVLNCNFYYNRGLKHEGCHAIDLFNYFFGELIDGNIILDNSICDYSQFDPTYAAFFTYQKCPYIFMFPVDGRKISIFEMNIMFEKARVSFVDHGTKLNIYELTTEEIYDNTKVLSSTPTKTINTQLTKSLSCLIDNTVNYLDGNMDFLLCTDKDAIEVHEVYYAIGL